MKLNFKLFSIVATLTSAVIAQTTDITSDVQVSVLSFFFLRLLTRKIPFRTRCGNEPSNESVLKMEADFTANAVEIQGRSPLTINVSKKIII